MNWNKIRSRVLSSAECNDLYTHLHDEDYDDFYDTQVKNSQIRHNRKFHDDVAEGEFKDE